MSSSSPLRGRDDGAAAKVRPTRSIPSQYEVIEPNGYVAARFPDHYSAVDFANGYNLGLRRGQEANREPEWLRKARLFRQRVLYPLVLVAGVVWIIRQVTV